MKKNWRCIVVLLSLSFLSVKAEEGMWLPYLIIEKEADMQNLGMQISAEEIYNNDDISLKDAVVRFGRGCTGMMISGAGLLMTNHHCGYRQIQALSSLENNYLEEGFWAQNTSDELPCDGLSVTFLISTYEVTDEVLAVIDNDLNQKERRRLIRKNKQKITEEAEAGTHYKAEIKSFFNDNQYFLFIYEIFEDVRLVGAPPRNIGKYGGDTDNWMWPRHTGDFALFRVYADENNKPAAYTPENVPYTPRKHLQINLAGVNHNDFTFVYGFPGRTNQYATSYEIDIIKNVQNPISIKMRDIRLDIIREAMNESDEVHIKYAAKQASIANGWKKWIGENRGLRRLRTLDMKREKETAFTAWATENPQRNKKYGGLMTAYEQIFDERRPAVRDFRYLMEAAFGSEVIRFAYSYLNLLTLSADKPREGDKIEAMVDGLKDAAESHFRNYDYKTDKNLFAQTMKAYYESFSHEGAPEVLQKVVKRRHFSFEDYANQVYENSIFTCPERLYDFLDNYRTRHRRRILRDPAFKLAQSIYTHYYEQTYPLLVKHNNMLDSLNRIFMQGLMEWQNERHFYPDANGTLRITYGRVLPYKPADAVSYDYYTSIEGIFQKALTTKDDYQVHPRLRDLYLERDFGPYTKNQTLPVCFIAANHTSGGNSGSPVFNAYGQLVGINFDRNWEGTMSDIHYDPVQGRNISVDVRYILFIIDKFAGAGHLLKEMDIIHH